jgi:hypothetical protein
VPRQLLEDTNCSALHTVAGSTGPLTFMVSGVTHLGTQISLLQACTVALQAAAPAVAAAAAAAAL